MGLGLGFGAGFQGLGSGFQSIGFEVLGLKTHSPSTKSTFGALNCENAAAKGAVQGLGLGNFKNELWVWMRNLQGVFMT